jgi:glucose-1-phosphate adenylyltransferase
LLLQDTIMFGADNLDSSADRQAELAAGTIPLGVGEGSKLQKAIIDSNARIGRGVSLTNKAGVQDGSNSNLPKGVVIRDGILVVMRGAVVPDGTVV